MKKLISMLLAVCMVLALMPCAFAADAPRASKFTDVPENAWYYDELDYAVYNGYISGTSDTTFSPNGNLTRSQFVTILGRMLGASTASGQTKFKDVPANSWYAPYVAWAAANGYVNGTSATTFAPDAYLTVEQMATIIANYISKTGVTLNGYTASESYKDMRYVSKWAAANVEVMRQYGLLHTENGTISPQRNTTRAEGAFTLVLLARYTGLGVEPNPVGGGSETIENEPTSLIEADDVGKKIAESIHDELWALGEITSTMTDKEKAIVYFDWMMKNCGYRNTDSYTWRYSSYGALGDGFANCYGLAKAYRAFLQLEGITCTVIMDFDNVHAWNEALLDGAWYKIDMSGACINSKNPDGSYNKFGGNNMRNKYFSSPIDEPTMAGLLDE